VTAQDETLKKARAIDTGQALTTTEKSQIKQANESEDGTTLESVKTFISENPGPSLLIGAGLAWYLVNRERRKPRQLTDRMKDRADAARERASDAVHNAQDAVHSAQEKGHSYLESAGEKARLSRERVTQRYDHLKETNPLILGAGAMAAGIFLGLMLPATRREDELMGETRDSLLEQAGEIVRAAKEAAIGSLQSSKEEVIEHLTEAKEEATSAMKESFEEAKSAAKDEAKDK